MRKTIQKEIFYTTCRVSELQIIDNQPIVVERDPERFIGKVSQAKIASNLKRMYKKSLVPYEIKTESFMYEMTVDDFIKHATLVETKKEVETK